MARELLFAYTCCPRRDSRVEPPSNAAIDRLGDIDVCDPDVAVALDPDPEFRCKGIRDPLRQSGVAYDT